MSNGNDKQNETLDIKAKLTPFDVPQDVKLDPVPVFVEQSEFIKWNI